MPRIKILALREIAQQKALAERGGALPVLALKQRFHLSDRAHEALRFAVAAQRGEIGQEFGVQMQPCLLGKLNKALRQSNGVRGQRAPVGALCGLIFGQIGQREQTAVEVVAVSIVFVQPVRRKLPIQIRPRLPGQRVETAAANQRAGRAHAGFPFRPPPVAFTILKSERNFGAMHRAFEEVARQGCAVHNTA